MINELTVYREKLFENLCPSFDFEGQADELYQLILDRIDALPIQPVGLSAGVLATEDARAVLKNWFNAH